MPDLLVKLYDLPYHEPEIANGAVIRPVNPAEISIASNVIESIFSKGWADEFTRGAHQTPISALIAVENRKIIGFACFDTSALGLFGPTGVLPEARGKGVGKALLLKALTAMKEKGHAYAIIGWAGPVDYYKKHIGATIIEGSERRYEKQLVQK